MSTGFRTRNHQEVDASLHLFDRMFFCANEGCHCHVVVTTGRYQSTVGGGMIESILIVGLVVPSPPHAAMDTTIAHERVPLSDETVRRGLRFRSNSVTDLAPSRPRTRDSTDPFSNTLTV